MNGRDHIEDGPFCWCRPDLLRLCPDCNTRYDKDRECLRCGGRGLVKAIPINGEIDLVVHYQME